MMYYALTVKDGIITGVHESESLITDKTFENNPNLVGQEVMSFKDAEYSEGHKLAEYTDGILRPLLDRINEGLTDIPEGFELIDGELANLDVPIEDAPPKILDILSASDAKIAALEAELAALKPIMQQLIDSQKATEPVKEDSESQLPLTK